jgi:hypothetical protein
MPFNIVKTISGKDVPRSNCRKINGEYHEIGVDCFLMPDGKYHRVNNGKIEFDHEVGKYVLISENNLIEGYVDVDKDGAPILGYFSSNESKNVIVNNLSNYSNINCISEEVAEKCGFVEDLGSGVFIQGFDNMSFHDQENARKKRISGGYNFPIDYGAATLINQFDKYHKKYYSTDRMLPSYTKELGNTTFGKLK